MHSPSVYEKLVRAPRLARLLRRSLSPCRSKDRAAACDAVLRLVRGSVLPAAEQFVLDHLGQRHIALVAAGSGPIRPEAALRLRRRLRGLAPPRNPVLLGAALAEVGIVPENAEASVRILTLWIAAEAELAALHMLCFLESAQLKGHPLSPSQRDALRGLLEEQLPSRLWIAVQAIVRFRDGIDLAQGGPL